MRRVTVAAVVRQAAEVDALSVGAAVAVTPVAEVAVIPAVAAVAAQAMDVVRGDVARLYCVTGKLM